MSYALRNALLGSAKSLVRNMSDQLDESRTRLDERYGDDGKVVEIVLDDIKHFGPIREYNERRLTTRIDIIENASMELKCLWRKPEKKSVKYFNNR